MSSLAPALDLSRCPALNRARQRSLDLLARATRALTALGAGLDGIETIALGGSLGRLEASDQSDFDCIVVVRTDPAPVVTGVVERIHAALCSLSLKQPKSWGIYHQPVSTGTLLDHAGLGSLDEPPAIFGKRIQLLLDAQPVYRAAALQSLQARIIDWYGTGYLDADPGRSWTYLINDLSRYLHAYAAWQQYKFARTADDSWQLRQAKLRSSRVVTIAGLLLLLGESNSRRDKQSWLAGQLFRPPLDRLHLIMTQYDAGAFSRLLAAYEEAFRVLSDPAARAELVRTGPEAHGDLPHGTAVVFERFKRASQDIVRILTNFVLDRRGDWDPRFFERLLF